MAEYYVDPDAGDNTNDGSTTALAWATRAHAAATIAAGDIVYCMATATDTESSITVSVHSHWIGVNASGVADGTKYVCSGDATDPTFISETSVNSGVHLWNFHFTSAGSPLQVTGGSQIQVKSCLADGGSPYFIDNITPATNSSCSVFNTTVEGTTTGVFRNNASRRTMAEQIGNTYIDCTQVYNTQATATNFQRCTFINTPLPGTNTSNMNVVNCLLYNSILNLGDRTASVIPHHIVNSVFHSSSGYAINYVGGNSAVPRAFSNNLFYNNTSGITNGSHVIQDNTILTSDPGYANPATGDFTFGPDSPLVGAGANGGNIGPTAYTPLTPAQIAAGVWTREGRTLTS